MCPIYPDVSQFSLRASSVYQSVRQVQLVLFIIIWYAASTILVIIVIFALFLNFCNNFVSSPDFFCPFASCFFLPSSLFVGTFSQSYGLIQLHIWHQCENTFSHDEGERMQRLKMETVQANAQSSTWSQLVLHSSYMLNKSQKQGHKKLCKHKQTNKDIWGCGRK